jgi:5-deoxy-glucuronate isomerase
VQSTDNECGVASQVVGTRECHSLERSIVTVQRHLKSQPGLGVVLDVTPRTANWTFLSFRLIRLKPGSRLEIGSEDNELALVPLGGTCEVIVEGHPYRIARTDVFAERGSLLYVAPNLTVVFEPSTACLVAVGGAPASQIYPVRKFGADETRVELRGGGAALRQIGHLLAPEVPAHRLLVYEVYVPRGSWSGWPPHCHDGYDGSPYLEETYYFRLDPPDGYAIHRNYRKEKGIDEVFVAHNDETVLVAEGYHSTVACPGANLYFLNFLAGDLEHGDRATAPVFEERYRWIEGKWDEGAMRLPTA